MTKKRINITVEAEPYELLMDKARKIGFKNNWYSKEIIKLNQALNGILDHIIESHESGILLTEKQEIRQVLDIAEQAYGVKIAEIIRKAK